jgi:hypothetical protein
MLRLRFYTPGQGSAESIEPGPFFRLIGAVLCRGTKNEPIATYQTSWTLMDGEFTRAEWTDPVMIYFEDNAGRATSAFGPFEAFHIAEGCARAGSRVLARFDDKTMMWYPAGAQDGWVSLLVTPKDMARLDLIPPPYGRRASDRQAKEAAPAETLQK